MRETVWLPTFLVTIILSGCVSMSPEKAKEMTIVKDGVSVAPIVIAGNATPQTKLAAKELADYVEKITGARPEIIDGTPDPLPDHAVWVGYQPVLDDLFPDLDFDFKKPEEILIACDGDNLVIAGRDRWDPESMVVESTGKHFAGLKDRQWEYGTANAVYAFLRKYLDVLWLWPGDVGEDVVKNKTIAFAPFEYRYHPQFRQRGTIFRQSARGDGRGHSHDWTRRQGLQLDSLNTPGGHAFTTWWDRFHEKHPDYFALQPDGTRSGYRGPRWAKLCQSNPKVWNQWIADVAEKLEEDPNATIFNAAPNDSAGTGVCVCEKCRAWDQPEAAPYTYSYENGPLDYVAMSDRYCEFTNRLARELKERFPDRDLKAWQMAYHCCMWPPLKTKLDDNVIISFVGNFPLTDEADRKEQKRRMAGWRDIAPEMVYRPNQWAYAGALGIPQVAPRELIDDFQFLADNNCVGLFVDTNWEHWATTGPHYYLMGRLGWDPRQDGEGLLEEYYSRGFGKAANDVKAYWELMAKEFGDLGYRARLADVVKSKLDASTRSKAEELLNQAAEKVANEPKIYQQRVAFVRAGFEYTKHLFDLVALLEQSGGKLSPEATKQANAIWKQIKNLSNDHPHAFNYRWIPNRMARRTRFVPPDMD